MNMIALLAALIFCVVCSSFFSAAETAYTSANKVRLKILADENDRRARKALKLIHDYDILLTTILIGNNIVNIAATAISTILFSRCFSADLAATVSTVVMTVIILLFGEISPKMLAKRSAEATAMSFSGILSVLIVLLRPVNLFFSLWRKMLESMFKAREADTEIEEELITIVDEAEQVGDIEPSESDLIRSAISFNDREAIEIMTPRVDVTALSDDTLISDTADLFLQSGYSRIPVYHEDLDHITGVLNEKDFYLGTHKGIKDIVSMMKPAVFAPSTVRIRRLLEIFRENQTHIVILLDEFGGTEGIVTMEDALEELVGEIYDEHDEISQMVTEEDDGSILIDGLFPLSELMERFGISGDFISDTAGGWAAEMLGRIPAAGDNFRYASLSCEVNEMEKRRVKNLKLSVDPGKNAE